MMLKHLILAVSLAAPLPALAQESTGHEGHMMGDMGPASMAFMEANQGAVDMAKIVLAHGKDPEVKKLAEDIIKAQEAEIKWMTDWLAKNGG
jgi:uncharacterized protein (DUF305 family)